MKRYLLPRTRSTWLTGNRARPSFTKRETSWPNLEAEAQRPTNRFALVPDSTLQLMNSLNGRIDLFR